MNVLASECTSGCESGWTLYLDQSYSTTNASHGHRVDGKCSGDKWMRKKCEDEEEEDLSMVSDASSGPPHFQEEEENYSNENGGFFSAPTSFTKSSAKRKKNKGNRHLLDQQLALFDDTASSPAFNFSQTNYAFTSSRTSMESVLNFSQDVPTPYQSGSALQGHHHGYMQSSHSQNQFENNQLSTRRWK